MSHAVERIPSVDTVRLIVNSTAAILDLTGPNTPPGYASAVESGEPWAKDYNISLMMRTSLIESASSHRRQGAWIFQGWPTVVILPLRRIADVSLRLLTSWGLTRSAELPPYPGMEDSGGRAGNQIPTRPMLVPDEDYEALAWCAQNLFEYVDAFIDSPESPPEPPPTVKPTPEAPAVEPEM